MPPITNSPSDAAPLRERHCQAIAKGAPPLTAAQAAQWQQQLNDWERDGDTIRKVYRFRDFYQTMAFVNALAWIAHQEDHHPDIEVGYNRCSVRYTTHAVGGLSLNDFICAAKVDALSATAS